VKQKFDAQPKSEEEREKKRKQAAMVRECASHRHTASYPVLIHYGASGNWEFSSL
jgi:hypothetical protein